MTTRLELMQRLAQRLGVYAASTLGAGLSSGATTLTDSTLAAYGAELINGVVDVAGQVRTISTVDPCTGVITFCPGLGVGVSSGAALKVWPQLPSRLAEALNVGIRNCGERFMVTKQQVIAAYNPLTVVYELPVGAMAVLNVELGSDVMGWQVTRAVEVHVTDGARVLQMRGGHGLSAGSNVQANVGMRITYTALPSELASDSAVLDAPDNVRELALFVEEFAMGVLYERQQVMNPSSDVGRTAGKAMDRHYGMAAQIQMRQRAPSTPAYTRGRVFAAQI